MKECDIPLSPNWFLSSVSSGNSSGLYAFGGRQEVFVYDTSKASPETLPKLVCVYSEHKELVSTVCLSHDPEQLMCCSSDDKNVKLWDVRSLITIQCHSEHTEQITCSTWSPKNADLILTASEKGNIVIWRLKDNTVSSFQLERDYIIAMKASPHCENTVLIGYKQGLAVIADFSKNQPQIVQRFSSNDGEITSVCWCPRLGENFINDDNDSNGALLATVGRKYIKVWSSLTGRQISYKELQRSYSSDVPDFMSKKMWIDLYWPPSRPDDILFTSLSGDLNVWDLRVKGSQKPQHFSYKRLKPHQKKIFNVVPVGNSRLASFSLDRVVCVWDIDALTAVCSMPTFGGHMFCARASPLDPGYVAIGSGGNTISVWNQGSKYSVGDVTCLNYGTRSKITCVAWHPEKEGLLAFGSDDGRVGVCNVLTKRPPTLSSTFHRKTVYVVCWAYPLKNDKENDKLTVYSVGDGNVLQHFMTNDERQKDALNVMDCLKEINGDLLDGATKSELSWSHDYTKFAIGSGSGVVEIFNFPDLRIVCTIECQTKLVNCIRWHPLATEETTHTSAYRSWIALAGNDNFISILDLAPVDGSLDLARSDQTKPMVLTQPLRLLKGHSKRVTDMCWSLHKDAHLVSVSYDSNAIVWNAKTAEALVCYSEHNERLLTVLWSGLDPDLIMTAGSDSLLRVWRVSSQPPVNMSTVEKKPKRKVTSNPLAATSCVSTCTESAGDTEFDSEELKDLKDLLEMKKRQLLMQVDSLVKSEDLEGDEVNNTTTAAGAKGDLLPLQTSSSSPPSSTVAARQLNSHRAVTEKGNHSLSNPTFPAEEDEKGKGEGGVKVKADGRNRISNAKISSTAIPANDHSQGAAGDGEKKGNVNASVRHAGVVDDGCGDYSDNVGVDDPVSVEDLVPPVKPLLPRYLPSSSSSVQPRRSATSGGANNQDFQEGVRKRKPKIRSFFPVLSKEANKGKASLQEDLVDLTTVITGQGDHSELVDNKPHLGLYVDRLGTHRCLLQESEYHLSQENMEYHLQVEIWRGNVAGALQIARQRNELSDWIVAMAPLASHELWEVVCVEYAEHLEEEGHYHKAASYLLAGHRVHQAIELFRNHRLYKEAVSLARIRLSPVDPILEDLYTEWGQSLMKDGQFEQAAKCYLAMRQIQEASKMVARRNDQSSLRTACHISLSAKDGMSGMEYAFKLFSQYLIAGDWKEAYGFVKEHNSLKPFLLVLSTHELLVEQLTALCPGTCLTQKPLDSSSSFGQWGTQDRSTCKDRINLPDFLVNKLDTDPVVPWDPVLIDGHTFPHHVLRQWYYRLNMDVLPCELKSSFSFIAQMLEFQKSYADIPQSMVVLSTHLTLCFISLLLSETSTAITHLLQATAFLHQNERRGNLMCHFCQLVLPQGPKYLLKLQQEFNASRLVISMESPGGGLEQAGGEGHSTIKKYLSEIKDNDRGISSTGSRCRELDCVRSFYYLAVLEYLNEEFSKVGQHGEDDGIPPHKDAAAAATRGTESRAKCDETGDVSSTENGKVSDSSSCSPKKSPSQNSATLQSLSSFSMSAVDKNNIFSSPVDPSDHRSNYETPRPSSDSSTHKEVVLSPNTQPNSVHEKMKSENELKSLSSSLPTSSSASSSSTSGIMEEKSKSSLSHLKSKLDHKNLLHISKGILWDVQAKREALTETLGYVHRAISQHLLTNRSESSSSTQHAFKSTSQSPPGYNTLESTSADEDGSCHSSRLLLPPSSSPIPSTTSTSFTSSPVSAVTNSSSSTQQPGVSTNGNTNTKIPPTSSRPVSYEGNNNASRRTPLIHRSISETVSSKKISENATVPTDVIEIRQKVEEELLGILPTSPTITSHKSRKVIWRDSKEESSSGYTEDALVKRNPEGTQIPMEWDNLPVDLKYTQPYISQALLKQEQETIAAELKQVPDGSQVPFPSVQRCSKTLLDACVSSIDLNAEEKQAYMKHLKDWSVLFAVTSYDQERVEKDFATAFQQQQ